MKTFYKVMALLGAALLGLGIVITSSCAFNGGARALWENGVDLLDYMPWREAYHETEQAVTQPIPSAVPDASMPVASATPDAPQSNRGEIHKLDLELGAGEFELVTGDTFEVTTATGRMNGLSISSDDDTWKIESTGTWLRSTGRVKITVPADFVADDVDIEIGAGKLTINGLHANNASFSVGAGQMDMKNCTLANAKFECAMGELLYQGALTGTGSVDCGMGNVEIEIVGGDSANFGYTVDCGVGNVSMFDRSYSGIAADATQNPGALNFYSVDCGMGNVEFSFS